MPFSYRKPSIAMQVLTRKGKTIIVGDDDKSQISVRSPRSTTFPSRDILEMRISNSVSAEPGTFSIKLIFRMANGLPLYPEIIKPLDIVNLFMNSSNESMIGIIDKVRAIEGVQGRVPVKFIMITGRALSAIWVYDLVKFYQNALGLTPEQQKRNLDLQNAIIGLDFFNEPAYKAIMEIYAKMPMLEGTLTGGKTISDYVSVGDELYSRAGEKIFNTNLNAYNGTILRYFQEYAGMQINELWSDCKDGVLHLRMRPTPFSLANDSEIATNHLGEDILVSWDDMSTWIGSKPYHTLNIADERHADIGQDHSNAYSVYSVTSGVRLVTSESENSVYKPIIDDSLVKELGTRDLSVRVNFLPLSKEQDTTTGTFEQMAFYRNKLYLWNRDNHRMYGGNVAMKGDADIRAGDRLLRSKDSRIYYIENVEHVYIFGQPMESTLQLDRGLTNTERRLFYNEGEEYLRGLNA